jgi:hypothetical protein
VKITPKIITVIVICLIVLGFLGFGLYKAFNMPLPGQEIAYDCSNDVDFSRMENLDVKTADKCRVHVNIGTVVHYQTNPPVFGPHYPDWVRAGVYEAPKDDRNLVHSLEHGYVEIHYNCGFSSQNPDPLGQNNSSESAKFATGSAEQATTSAQLSPAFSSSECKSLVAQLTKIYDDEGHTKLIVVPRPNLDANLAVTAWGRIDKWRFSGTVLTKSDIDKIKNFIEVLRGHGPEQTME